MANRRQFLKGAAALALAAAAAPAIALKALAAPSQISAMEMYEVAGQTIFPFYSLNGGICARSCLFPMIRHTDGLLVYRHDVSMVDYYSSRESRPQFYLRVEREAMAAFEAALARDEPWLEIEDGGLFPEPGVVAILRPRKEINYG